MWGGRRWWCLVLTVACRDAPATTAGEPDAGPDAREACTGAGITKGPWSLAPDGTSVIVRWESCRPDEGTVHVLEEALAPIPRDVRSTSRPFQVTEETTAAFNPGHPPDRAGTFFMHEARITGLAAGTCHRAQLAADGSSLRFCTARPSGERFRFGAIADTSPGQGTATVALVTQLGARQPDFTLHGGDLQYYPFETWSFWFGAMRPFLAQAPLFPAIGNHESEKPTEREAYVRRFFGVAARDGTDERYRFEWGGVWFFALGTEEGIGPGTEQATWLERSLADARQQAGFRFSVVYFHKPLVTCGDKEDDPAARRLLEPIFLREKVALVIQSHLHGYERFETAGLTYLTTGGGGAGLQAIDTNTSRPYCNQRVASGAFFHAMVFDVADGKLTGTAMDEQGATRDTFEKVVP